jgi:RNA polymerase sigma-70 factor (ECF subfamily)
MYRLAFSYCRNREDAEDVVQEVFLKLLRQKSEFLDEQKLRSWLLKVTVNACMDLLRSPWRGRCCALEEATEPTVLMQEESELMLAVLHLPAKYRGVIHLYYYEDYSITEIAGILNVSESAVRMRLISPASHRACRLL